MPLYLYFTEREIQTLQLYARGQRHLADNCADGDVDFWDSLLCKLAAIHQHPMCCWCDSLDWSLDDPNSIPEEFGCQHGDSAPDPASRRYTDHVAALRANQARALGAGSEEN